jgi:hypothetical protein
MIFDWGLLAGLWFLVAMAYPAHCCCCPCEVCETGTTPPLKQVTISGVAEVTCGSCASFNGVFLLEQLNGPGPNCCVWRLTLDAVTCGVLVLQFNEGGFNSFQVSNGVPSVVIEFQDYGSSWPRDCQEEVSLTFFQQIGSFTCNWSGATITVA